MKKELKQKFVEKRLGQKRYLIRFSKNVDFELLKQEPTLNQKLE